MSFGPFVLSAMLGFGAWPNGGPKSSDAISDLGPFGKLPIFPDIVHFLYSATHSLVIYALFFALLWWLGKKNFTKLTLAWPLHILVDIPTHSADFFPTHFLWPVSNFFIDGISWARPIIFIPNVIIILILYLYWYMKKRKIKV